MNERKYERYYSLAGKASFENWDTVKRSGMCGCYYCGSIFPASEVGEDDWTPDWHGRTVLCPRCGIDAVLGDACGIPIREDVLEELYEEKFGSGGPDPRIVGSGTFNLDTIVVRDRPDSPAGRAFTERVALQEVGGTCGNVMCLLAGMGFEAYPQACLDDSPEGLRITDDLERYGCDTRFVTNTPDGGTTLQHIDRYGDILRTSNVMTLISSLFRQSEGRAFIPFARLPWYALHLKGMDVTAEFSKPEERDLDIAISALLFGGLDGIDPELVKAEKNFGALEEGVRYDFVFSDREDRWAMDPVLTHMRGRLADHGRHDG